MNSILLQRLFAFNFPRCQAPIIFNDVVIVVIVIIIVVVVIVVVIIVVVVVSLTFIQCSGVQPLKMHMYIIQLFLLCCVIGLSTSRYTGSPTYPYSIWLTWLEHKQRVK